jgi:hypothetical protein
MNLPSIVKTVQTVGKKARSVASYPLTVDPRPLAPHSKGQVSHFLRRQYLGISEMF